MRTEIRIAGFGGQGVSLAGYILGKALALYEGREAVMTRSYGPEARGGASSANIVFSDQPIAYPFVHHPDVLITLSQEAYATFRPTSGEDARVFIDDGLVSPLENDNVLAIPATNLAEQMGQRMVGNMIMLGFFTSTTGLVRSESMIQSIESTVKPKTVELNISAFRTGHEFGLNCLASIIPEKSRENTHE